MTTQKRTLSEIVNLSGRIQLSKTVQALRILILVAAGCAGLNAMAESRPEIPGRYHENEPVTVLKKGDKIIFTNRANPGKEDTIENRSLRFTNDFEGEISKSVALKFFNKRKYDSLSFNKLPKELLQKINSQGEIAAVGAYIPSAEQGSAEIFNALENLQLEIALTDSPTIEEIEGTGQTRMSFHFKPIDIMINNKLRITITDVTVRLVNNEAVVREQYQIKDLNATFGEHAAFVRGNISSKKVPEEETGKEQQRKRPSKTSSLRK